MPRLKPMGSIHPSQRIARGVGRKNWQVSRVLKTRVKPSLLEMDSNSSSSSDGESEEYIPEPIGEMMQCTLCEDRFYDPTYLNWHVMNEHGEEVVGTLKIHQGTSSFFRSPVKRIGVIPSTKVSQTASSGGRTFPESRRTRNTSESPNKLRSTPGTSVKSSESSDQFQCSKCEKCFRTSGNLGRHMKLHQSKMNSCKTCGYKAFTPKLLKLHVERSHPTLVADSKEVLDSKASFVKSSLHKNSSVVVKRQQKSYALLVYTCPLCDAAFSSDGGIKYHVKARHPNQVDFELECKHCEFATQDLLQFIKHRFGHNEEKIFKCKFCHKPFSSKSGKLTHEKLHGTSTRFDKCPFCKVVFFGFGLLKTHILNEHMESNK